MGGVYIKGLKLPKDELAIFKDGKYIEWNRGLDFKEYEVIDIVTCGECIWSYTDERDGLLWCKVHMSHYRVNHDDFCSYGERRSE